MRFRLSFSAEIGCFPKKISPGVSLSRPIPGLLGLPNMTVGPEGLRSLKPCGLAGYAATGGAFGKVPARVFALYARSWV